MKEKSCLINLLEVFDVTCGIEKVVLYLDFQKAFDEVPLRRLVCKIKARGIGDIGMD